MKRYFQGHAEDLGPVLLLQVVGTVFGLILGVVFGADLISVKAFYLAVTAFVIALLVVAFATDSLDLPDG